MLGVLLGSNRADDGVIIDGVTPQSGAAEAGLRGGDKIVLPVDVRVATEISPTAEVRDLERTAVSGGVWTVNVGYGRERIADAVRDQLVKMNYFAQTAGTGLLILRLVLDMFVDLRRVATGEPLPTVHAIAPGVPIGSLGDDAAKPDQR